MSNLDDPLYVPIWHRTLLTVAEAAALTGVSLSTAHRWTREGLRTVPHIKEKRISRKALDEFLADNPAELENVA